MLKKISLIFFLLATNYLLLTTYSYALELNSPRFKLDIEKPDIDLNKAKSVVYTIQSLQGEEAFKRFKSNGYIIKSYGPEKDLIFSVSQSIINLGEISPGRSAEEDVVLSVSTSNELDYAVNLIQEYPLKNFSGETLDLNYSLSGDNLTRSLPNQNEGDLPRVIMTKSSNQPVKVTFKLNPAPSQSAGTYETVVDFVAIPGY